MKYFMKHLLLSLLITTLTFGTINSSFGQSGCVEIESILVNSCAPGAGLTEGLNEMMRFRVGATPLNVSDLALQWANTNLAFNGLRQDAGTAQKTLEFNLTITSCGFMREPVLGVLPANSQVLLVTSYNVNTNTNFFQNLSDTLTIIYANESTNSGHFLNYVPNANPNIQTTRISFPTISGCMDEVSYFRTSLITTAGLIGDEDGARVDFTDDGVPTYLNIGCVAPVNIFSAAFNVPPICNTTELIQLDDYVTGAAGGTWSGTGVTNGVLDPSQITGSVDITYTVTSDICQQTVSVTNTVLVSGNISASWVGPEAFCFDSDPVDLNLYVTGTPGGSWSGIGVSGSVFNPFGVFGSANLTYTVTSGSCTVTSMQSIPNYWITATFTPPSQLCGSSSPIDLTQYINNSETGSFSGPGVAGTSLITAGLSGIIDITYTATSSICSSAIVASIEISGNADASWDAPEFICSSGAPINLNELLTGTPGGQWSGTGVLGSSFDPTGVVGNVDITYMIGSGDCNASETHTIIVGDLPQLNITGQFEYCGDETPTALTANAVQDGIVTWYADESLTVLLATGPTYTPATTTSATYYAYQSFGDCSSALSSVEIISSTPPNAPITETSVVFCEGESIPAVNATSLNSIQWYSDATLQNLLGTEPTYQPETGTTQLYVVASNHGCVSEAVLVEFSSVPTESAQLSSTGSTICNGSTVTLTATTSAVGQWSTGASSEEQLIVSQGGVYTVTVVGQCNTSVDEITITDLTVNSNFELASYQGEAPFIVGLTTSGPSAFCDFTIDGVIVNPNSSNQISFLEAGVFSLLHTCDNQGCVSETTREVTVGDGTFTLEIPNSFTPNGDGFNDFFKPKVATGISEYRAVMFDRWGQEVVQWEGSATSWDGTNKGNPSPDGVYFYVIRGKDLQNNDFERHGSVTLIRN
jgi:gliding motility-associated-like protein